MTTTGESERKQREMIRKLNAERGSGWRVPTLRRPHPVLVTLRRREGG